MFGFEKLVKLFLNILQYYKKFKLIFQIYKFLFFFFYFGKVHRKVNYGYATLFFPSLLKKKLVLQHPRFVWIHLYDLNTFLVQECSFLNSRLVVRFREARLELEVVVEYCGKHDVFCNTGFFNDYLQFKNWPKIWNDFKFSQFFSLNIF
jgi:hypothetical protein